MQKNLVSSRVRVGHLQSNSSQPIGELATSGWASLWYYSSAPVQIYPLAEVSMGLCVVLELSTHTGIPFLSLSFSAAVTKEDSPVTSHKNL